MTEKDMKRMSRVELLELLVEQMEEVERLEQEVKTLTAQLEEKTIAIETSGSIAEAALKLNKVFEAADEAARQYLESVKKQSENRERKKKK